jgi:hypothetical protein
MFHQPLWASSARRLRRAIVPATICAGLTLGAILVTARPALAMNPCNEANPPARCFPPPPPPPPPPVAPSVTNLHPTFCGALCLEWDWTGHAGDTDYLVTTIDRSTGQLLSSLTGPDAGTHAEQDNLLERCGHRYQIFVTTVKTGDINSPPVSSTITQPTCLGGSVADLHSTACGNLCLQWDWTAPSGDTNYLITTTDETTGQVLSSLTGMDTGTHAEDANHGEVCGHTYQISVADADFGAGPDTSDITLPPCGWRL